jgi:hypothetical protein
MTQQEMDFIGGGFKLTLPYTVVGWIVWIFGFILVGLGVVATIAQGDPLALMLSMVGFIVLAISSPGSLEAGLHNLRKSAIDPGVLEQKAKESGYTMENWFLQQSTLVPTNDPNDWILPAPGPQTWNNADPYGPHGDGTPLPEHPVKVGTPRPATMTTFSIFSTLAVIGIVALGGVMMQDEEADLGVAPAGFIAGLGLILALLGYVQAKKLGQMLDVPTSLVRSAAVGHPELVGQVRPWAAGTMTVHVDSDSSMSMANMLGYHWTYEQYQCRTVEDSEGNKKEECNWVIIRSDSGGVPFILQDGTGGIKVNLPTFKRTEYGQFLKQWDGAYAKSLGKQLMASVTANLLRDAQVKKHRWRLYGLRSGDPVYVLGAAKPRPAVELQGEGLDGTLGNSTIEVMGDDDGMGMKCTLMRGTELANIGKSRSGFEMLLPPILLLLGGIGLFGLA